MPNCPMCGKPVEADAAFCDSCGYTLGEGSMASSGNAPEPFESGGGMEPPSTEGEELAAAPAGEEMAPPEPEAPSGMNGYLVCPDGSEIPVTETQKLIGRVDLAKFASKQDANVISRAHLTVYQESDKFYVEDGKTRVQEKPSINKTWLVSGGNEEEITGKGRRELQDGDEISVAGLVKLRFKTG
jgi:zinc-ribbon domain/FHA domain